MFRKLIIVLVFALLIAACDDPANSKAPTAANTGTANSNSAAANKTANANANLNSDATAPEAPDVQRIAFPPGQNTVDETMIIDPGGALRFVVTGKKGQVLSIESLFKQAKITPVTKGDDKTTHNKPGHFDTILAADGDYVFEVSNPIKDAFKTRLHISLDQAVR
jgi:hypothetical protein